MPNREPIISEQDHEMLLYLLDDESVLYIADARNVARLTKLLNAALKIPASRMPSTVVRLNWHVTLSDVNTGDVDVFTLVVPSQADIASGKLSVLSPLGIAILGRHLGQQVRVNIPSGARTLLVETIKPHCQADLAQMNMNTVTSV